MRSSNGSDGLLVGIEGIDGSGKTTLVSSLEHRLSLDFDVVRSKEPGENAIGRAHRELSKERSPNAYSGALISAADRWYKSEALQRHLDRGRIVLSDRYYLSGLAYHRADGISFPSYAELNENVLRPDLYLYLDVRVETAIDRLSGKSDRWETMMADVSEYYDDAVSFVEETDEADVRRIDAEQPKRTVVSDAVDEILSYTSD